MEYFDALQLHSMQSQLSRNTHCSARSLSVKTVLSAIVLCSAANAALRLHWVKAAEFSQENWYTATVAPSACAAADNAPTFWSRDFHKVHWSNLIQPASDGMQWEIICTPHNCFIEANFQENENKILVFSTFKVQIYDVHCELYIHYQVGNTNILCVCI